MSAKQVRFTAILLSLLMVFLCPAAGLAEKGYLSHRGFTESLPIDVPAEETAIVPESHTLNEVSLTAEEPVPLTGAEAAYYGAIASELKASDTASLTKAEEGGTAAYSATDSGLKRVLYSSVGGVRAASVSSIMLREGDTVEDRYSSLNEVTITAKDLLDKIQGGDEMAIAFGKGLGLGKSAAAVESKLQALVDEYDQQIAQGNSFEEPRFIIRGVNITVNNYTEAVSLTDNGDGTYTAALQGGDTTGYRSTVYVDSSASVTIVYDEKGQTTVTRRVKSDNPTDFVIALDVSGSMEWDNRGEAMLTALEVVLDEILADPDNTASIVFWANDSAVMQLDVTGKGLVQKLSGADGLTTEIVYTSYLADRYGRVSSTALRAASISALESLYGTGGGTNPAQGMSEVLNVLRSLPERTDRNTGVLLFTDGEANYYSYETATVEYQAQAVRDYNARIVNVSVGSEAQVQIYERYLNPESANYYRAGEEDLAESILYYNIPTLTNQELADKVTEMFETAFVDITTETRKLQTETITSGILAAYGADLLTTIPTGFKMVEIKGEKTPRYTVVGNDDSGNLVIAFDLGSINAGEQFVTSFCVVPDGDGTLGITAYKNAQTTVLQAQPVDRIQKSAEKDRNVNITVRSNTGSTPDRAEPVTIVNDGHTHDPVEKVVSKKYSPYDNNYHYISSETVMTTCKICGETLGTKTITHSKGSQFGLEAHQMCKGRCIICGYTDSTVTDAEKEYFSHLMDAIKHGKKPLDDSVVRNAVIEHLKVSQLSETEIEDVLKVLENDDPSFDTKYRDLFLMSLFNYGIKANGKDGNYYSWPWTTNGVFMFQESPQTFIDTLFHETGHAIEINLWRNVSESTSMEAQDWETVITEALFDDVKSVIRKELEKYKKDQDSTLTDSEMDQIIAAFVNGHPGDYIDSNGSHLYLVVDPSVENDTRLKTIYTAVRDNINSAFRNMPQSNGLMVCDVIGGVTNNKINDYWGHFAKEPRNWQPGTPVYNTYYWTDAATHTEKQRSEAWAEFFSSKITNSEEMIRLNETYFPKSVQLLDELADSLYRYYYNYYSETFPSASK